MSKLTGCHVNMMQSLACDWFAPLLYRMTAGLQNWCIKNGLLKDCARLKESIKTKVLSVRNQDTSATDILPMMHVDAPTRDQPLT